MIYYLLGCIFEILMILFIIDINKFIGVSSRSDRNCILSLKINGTPLKAPEKNKKKQGRKGFLSEAIVTTGGLQVNFTGKNRFQ